MTNDNTVLFCQSKTQQILNSVSPCTSNSSWKLALKKNPFNSFFANKSVQSTGTSQTEETLWIKFGEKKKNNLFLVLSCFFFFFFFLLIQRKKKKKVRSIYLFAQLRVHQQRGEGSRFNLREKKFIKSNSTQLSSAQLRSTKQKSSEWKISKAKARTLYCERPERIVSR